MMDADDAGIDYDDMGCLQRKSQSFNNPGGVLDSERMVGLRAAKLSCGFP